MVKLKHFALTVLLALLGNLSANAYDFLVDGIYYNIISQSDLTCVVTHGGEEDISPSYSGDVKIPSSVTYNGKTFSVTEIGDYAFVGCEDLTSVEIPNSVTKIGEHAFADCLSLTYVEIPNSVTTIGEYAFWQCISLTSVEIGNSVTEIGLCAFGRCYSLGYFSGKFASDDHRCLIVDGELIAFAPALDRFYIIPNSVTAIGDYVFVECFFLTSVVISNSVTLIGSPAFYGCSDLAEIFSLSTTPPFADSYSFSGVKTSTCVLKVPAEAVEEYKTADGWKDFQNIVALTDEELEALGVQTVFQNPELKSQNMYNLQGQPVDEGYRGIVIQGGKKMLRK